MGCDTGSTTYQRAESPKLANMAFEDGITPVVGKPLSVATGIQNGADIITVVIDIDGEKLFCHHTNSLNELRYVTAEALIQSEIEDGDEEPIILKGIYENENNMLEMQSIEVNGYKIIFGSKK